MRNRDSITCIEIEGNTVEEAIKKALRELKVPREEAKIEVLAEEVRGLFGMAGEKPARVRVSININKK
ncbi:MAG: Jag N-terminal domain-containing protein [Candidatus Omnitrophica bacterium]|nr:Jag N-terminal domain-containing protein [Candidatus Omnitrophota bacterium]